MSTNDDPTALTDDIIAALSAPFSLDLVEVKPGATSVKDGHSRALALAYVDWRAYARRLDAVVGPAHWSFRLIPWGPTRLIAELTILGITKTATGEGDAGDDNCGTSAEAQAKKRACAEFGLGRYLYDLPNNCWFDYDATKKRFVDAAGAAAELYRKAGLLPAGRSASPAAPAEPSAAARPPAAARPVAPRPSADPVQQGRARETLQQAERRTGVTPVAERSAEPPATAAVTPTMATKAQVRQLMQFGAEAAKLAEGRYQKTRFYDLTTTEADALIRQLNA
jgi:hypothetical protein